jgi:uncharacterized repeat protein (TIGR04052 family)
MSSVPAGSSPGVYRRLAALLPGLGVLLPGLGVLLPGLGALLSLGLAACGPAPVRPVTLTFHTGFGATPFSCQLPAVLPDGHTIEPSTLKLFVHDLRLIDADGTETPITLEDDGRWQSQGVAQLDFEDGTGSCRNGSSPVRTLIRGTVPDRSYGRGLRFRIGVPFAQNHANPVKAAPPLSDTTMHWDWRGGYKFFRFDARIDGRPYRIHLGSTGCDGTIGHITGCARPNRPEVRLDTFSLDHPEVSLDLAKLLEGLPPPGPVGAGGCMGGAEEPGCAPVFAHLGLEVATGLPRAAAEVFTP